MWMYEHNGGQHGPVSTGEVKQLIEAGVVTPNTRVCPQGKSIWTTAQMTELSRMFQTSSNQAIPTGGVSRPPGLKPVGRIKDLSGHTGFLKALLAISLLLAAIGLMASLDEYSILKNLQDGTFASELEAEVAVTASDDRQGLIAILWICLRLITAIVFLTWVYKASSNLRPMGGRNLEFTPGWSVGWYFVPFANIIKPFKSMMEIWTISKSEARSRFEYEDKILSTWWGLLFLSTVAARLSLRFADGADSLDGLLNASMANIASCALELPLCWVVILMVSRIWEMQATHLLPQARSMDTYSSPQRV